MTKQPKELYKEYPAPDEDQIIEQIWQEIAARQNAARSAQEPVHRGFNSKTYGVFWGYLDILETDTPYNVGLFSKAATYKVIVRFGGGASSIITDENKKDPCSISIKVIDAPGDKIIADDTELDSQNFVFLNSNAMFVPNLKDFHHVVGHQMSGNKFGLLSYFLNPFGGHKVGHRISQFKNLMSLCGQRLGNDLSVMRYWSMTPYALGTKACKYKLVPHSSNADHAISLQSTGFDFLRENISAILQNHDLDFDFQVQLQQNADAQPIEIASVAWDEQDAPLGTVARLRIPRQDGKNELLELADRLSFNPWTTPEVHRPLGGINRARKKVYDLSYANRSQQKSSPDRESLLSMFPQE